MKCLLCKREISERKIVYGGRWRDEERQLPLCRFHYGAYMAHGLKKLEKEHWLDKGVGGGNRNEKDYSCYARTKLGNQVVRYLKKKEGKPK